MMTEVAVIGGGVGGMATAIRLAARGHQVTLYERRTELGGKLTERRRTASPSASARPCSRCPANSPGWPPRPDGSWTNSSRCCPWTRCAATTSPTAACWTRPATRPRWRPRWTRLAPGEGAAWQRYIAWGERCWAATERACLSGPLEMSSLSRRSAGPADLLASAPGRTLAGHAARFFTDPRMIQFAARYATYSGSSPYQAPAALGCIPYLEHARGAWDVPGGLARLRDALAVLLAETGVEVRTGTRVTRVLSSAGAVTGIVADGGRIDTGLVVCAADAARLYRDLYPDQRMRRRIGRLGPSSSGLLVLAGVRGRTAGLAQHNVIFSADYRAEFTDIFRRGQPPADPTIYLGCSATADPSARWPTTRTWPCWWSIGRPPGALGLDARGSTRSCCWTSWPPRDGHPRAAAVHRDADTRRLRAALRRLAGIDLRGAAPRPPGPVPAAWQPGPVRGLYLSADRSTRAAGCRWS